MLATCSPERAGGRKSNFTSFLLLRQLDLLDLVERLHATLDLGGLGRVRGEAIDEPLLLGQHRLLSRVAFASRFSLADGPRSRS